MVNVIDKIHRLSPNQLRALQLLAKSSKGIIFSSDSGAQIGLKGKSLGGLFSSLARQNINSQKLVLAWGRPEPGKGLRWKLNEELISKHELLIETTKLLT